MSDTEFSPNMQPANDELTPFDVRDSSGRQGLVKLFVGFGILLVAALIVLKLYQPGVRDRNDPPKITAENTPFKVLPEDVGGIQTPHQDKAVFDVMDGKTPEGDVKPAAVPEAPIDLPAPEPIAPKRIKVTPKPVIVAPEQPVKSPLKPRPVVTTQPVKTPPPASAIVRAGNSEYVVQIASVRSQEDAQNVWNTINTKFNDLTSQGLYADVRRVDLQEKGIYYRTRIAGLADKDAASELCNNFKARGQACFVTGK
ncbi:MAG: SPOR domain-containing protein [Litorimonas sp.]